MRRRFRHTPRRLQWLLGTVFVALALPSLLLIGQAQREIRWESWHQQRSSAEQLAARIDAALQQWVASEEARGYAEYRYLTLGPDLRGSQPSALSVLPDQREVPGLMGHFQIDAEGRFSSPLLPDPEDARSLSEPLDAAQWQARQGLHDAMLDVLSQNQLVSRERLLAAATVLSEPEAPYADFAAEDMELVTQRAFDRLNIASEAQSQEKAPASGTARSLATQAPAAAARRDLPPAPAAARVSRREQSILLESIVEDSQASIASPARISIFESELDPFEFSVLDSGHLVLFRRAWRDGQRSIQGLLMDPQDFITASLRQPFLDSSLADVASMDVSFRARLLSHDAGNAVPGGPMAGESLYQHRLAAPLADLQLQWTLSRLPASSSAKITRWTALLLLSVLVLGFVALYRIGIGQLRLAQQQQNFIAAVSHELKTPLTSIRMYGELLQESWVSDAKRSEYISYIREESERLSRLIANVLQLARLERDALALDLQALDVDSALDLVRSRVASSVQNAGFEIHIERAQACAGCSMLVDPDALLQVMINLVDNALKFAAHSSPRRIDLLLTCRDRQVRFSVRDHGPGVERTHSRRIFELFYRGGDEMTRETAGTGIGLALVQQLVEAMGGEVGLIHRQPGAEFWVGFPLLEN